MLFLALPQKHGNTGTLAMRCLLSLVHFYFEGQDVSVGRLIVEDDRSLHVLCAIKTEFYLVFFFFFCTICFHPLPMAELELIEEVKNVTRIEPFARKQV
jgi:hypothetical protein